MMLARARVSLAAVTAARARSGSQRIVIVDSVPMQ